MPIDPKAIEGRAEPTRFNVVVREIPVGAPIQAVLDNDATHKHPKVLACFLAIPARPFSSEITASAPAAACVARS